MRQFTVEDILALEPCSRYDRTYVECLFNGYESVDIRDIRNAPIPVEDKFWVLASLYPEDTKKWAFTLCEQAAAVSKKKFHYKYWSKAVDEALEQKSSLHLKAVINVRKSYCPLTFQCFRSYEEYIKNGYQGHLLGLLNCCASLCTPVVPGYSRDLLFELQRKHLFHQFYKEIEKCSR